MALSGNLGTFPAMFVFNMHVSIVQCIGKMTTGAATLTRKNMMGLNHGNPLSASNEFVADRNPSNARSNNTHIGLNVAVQGLHFRILGKWHQMDPDRVSVTRSIQEMLRVDHTSDYS